MNPRDRRLYKFVDDLVRIAAQAIVEHLNVPAEAAQAVGISIANAVCLEYARFHLYVPANLEHLVLEPRNEEIWREYNVPGPTGSRPCTPERINELAVQFKRTDRQIYNIVAAARVRELASRQGTLPGLEPND